MDRLCHEPVHEASLETDFIETGLREEEIDEMTQGHAQTADMVFYFRKRKQVETI